VGRRRFLMRRALVGVVPDELLNRKPKAFFPQEPPKSISTEWANLVEAGQNIVSGSLGIINPNRFWEALQKALHKERVSIGSVRRTLTLESWLGHLMVHNVLSTSEITPRLDYSSLVETEQLQTSTQAKSSAS